jgi:hypothetical protein
VFDIVVRVFVISSDTFAMKTQEKTLMRKINRTQKKKDALQKELKKKRHAEEPVEAVDEEETSSKYQTRAHHICV